MQLVRVSWKKLRLHLTSLYLLELLATNYLCEINIRSLAALKKSLKNKETEIENDIFEVLKHDGDRRKNAGK